LSDQTLTPFSYAVLTLVGQGGAGPHDLVRMARQGRVYWDAADSQWYAEPKRLEALGHLTARKQPGRTRPRTHYTLTDKGRRALAAWMQEPARFPRIQHEAVVRLLAADIVGEKAVLDSLRALRAEIAEITARLDVAEQIATTIPSRERYLLLNHRLGRRIVQAHSAWLDEVERDLGSRPGGKQGSGLIGRGRRSHKGRDGSPGGGSALP
jgi:PadR family transcriptional regulator, regulatory protein AphA